MTENLIVLNSQARQADKSKLTASLILKPTCEQSKKQP